MAALASDALTPRQLQVIAVYARTGSRKEVCAVLGISDPTVDHLLTEAFRRLGAETAIEAFRVLGWLTVPDEGEAAVTLYNLSQIGRGY